jgi:TPR repeat protein
VFSVDSRTLVGVHVGEYEVCREARAFFCSNRFVTIEAIAERSPIIENLRRLAPALPNANRENEPDQASRLTTALSFQALLSSANSGDARSNWILGIKNEYASDPIERRLLGVPDYEDEPAFTKDDIQALAYYRVAADAGFAPAIVDLASFYYSGVAVPQDRQLAIQLLNQAAEQGDPRAQAWLSRLYEQEGSGVVRDFAIAAQYLRSAAEGGEPRSQYDLAYQILNTSGANQGQWEEAISLLERASQAGYPNARYFLAEQYRDGIKVPLNLDRARELYQQAAADGLVAAQMRLGQLGRSD